MTKICPVCYEMSNTNIEMVFDEKNDSYWCPNCNVILLQKHENLDDEPSYIG